MMKNYLALLILASSLWAACKNADDTLGDTQQYANFTNLQVGNYWVYERHWLDSNGLKPLGIFDSTFVEKDTIIHGKTYFKYMDDQLASPPGFEATFLRDSLHYLVSSEGQVLFSSENFVDTLQHRYEVFVGAQPDTLCFVYRKMTDDNLLVSVGAGTFVTKNAQDVFVMWPGYDQAGKVRPLHKRYAEGIGLVEETLPFYVSAHWYYVRRLVRYGTN